MSDELLLVGPLAEPELRAVLGLAGEAIQLRGRLLGGERAGIDHDGWPRLIEDRGEVAAIRVKSSPVLRRYAEIMGLQPVQYPDGMVLGVQSADSGRSEWQRDRWLPELAAAIAGLILDEPANLRPDQIAWRLPMLGVWAESRLRAAASEPGGGTLIAKRHAEDVRLHHRDPKYSGFFGLEQWRVAHRTHDGGFTPEFTREAFIIGDAVIVLPWDPVRDRVLVIEQFRIAPALRHDPQPWLLEPVAGRIDAGESPEEAARREALEEAQIELQDLIRTVHFYPSPGAVTEYLYSFIALTDLPDGITGVYGLDSEAEDIRGHILPRAELSRMVHDGEISNGPLVMLSLWLDGQAERIRAEHSAI